MRNEEIIIGTPGWSKVFKLVTLYISLLIFITFQVAGFIELFHPPILYVINAIILGYTLYESAFAIKCIKYFKTYFIIKNLAVTYYHNGSVKEYILTDLAFREYIFSNIYKIVDNNGNTLAYINGMLPTSKVLIGNIGKSI